MTDLNSKMYLNTSIRNIGLLTSLSLALLGTSKVFKEKQNNKYAQSFIYFSIAFLFISLIIGFLFVYDYIELIRNNDVDKKEYKFISIPVLLLITNIMLLITIYNIEIKNAA